jgi:hypothetical protein
VKKNEKFQIKNVEAYESIDQVDHAFSLNLIKEIKVCFVKEKLQF